MGPIAASRLLKKVRAATKGLSNESRAYAIEKQGKLTCVSGCAYCCYQKLLAAPWEGIVIYLHLKATGAWTPALRERVVQADRDVTDHTHRQWLQKMVPCVFLKETETGHGTCTVYAVRPAACMTTYSVTDDPANCAIVDESFTFGILQCPSPAGQRAEMEYVKSFGAIYPQCQPERYATLAGSVLRGEAFVEGLPEPDVHTVLASELGAPEVTYGSEGALLTANACDRFDKAAKEPDDF